jgi:hypothetical protein
MVLPGAVTLGWVLWKSVPAARGAYPLGMEPIYAGLVTSLLAWGASRFIREERLS